jgi:CrcB protein
MNLVAVALGGAIGASARYLAGRGLIAAGMEGFWAIAAINVVGAGILGYVTGAYVAEGFRNQPLFLFLTVGALGGFTTFSTWTADSVALWDEGRAMLAALNLVVPPIAGVGAVIAGLAIGRS